ncbi:hypothetical protein ACFX16_032633 [Malus domestica]
MQEELNQFEMNEVWSFIDPPSNTNFIDNKWIYKNKFDESGNVIRINESDESGPLLLNDTLNLKMLILMKHSILLFILNQSDFFVMDVKIAFLNGYLNEEV